MLTADKERVSARIPRESRKLLEKAAALSGATLNQFVVQASEGESARMNSQSAFGPVVGGDPGLFSCPLLAK